MKARVTMDTHPILDRSNVGVFSIEVEGKDRADACEKACRALHDQGEGRVPALPSVQWKVETPS